MESEKNSLSYVFGPVPSGRLGLSLGLDLLGERICSFNCLYCESGPTKRLTVRRAAYVAAGTVLDELAAFGRGEHPPFEVITLGGLGEPSLNTQMAEIIIGARKIFPGKPIAVLTNSSLMRLPKVRSSLALADIVLPSLDTLVPEEFKTLNRAHQNVDLEIVKQGLLDFRAQFKGKIFLEILLCKGINDSQANLALLKDFVPRLSPDRIDVVSLTRPGASELALAVDAETIEEFQRELGASQLSQPEVKAAPAAQTPLEAPQEIPAPETAPQEAAPPAQAPAQPQAPAPAPKSEPKPKQPPRTLPTRENVLASLKRRPQTKDQLAKALAAPLRELGGLLNKLKSGGDIEQKKEGNEVFFCLPEEKQAKTPKYKKKMYVSVLPEEQLEVALTEDGDLREYYVEMLHQAKTRGNIYKGKIHNIDPSLQAAFVNHGAERNGFLQIDEVHPEYYREDVIQTKSKFPPIQKALKKGQELLVQVVKEPTGGKGAFLTTYLSLPGRYFVLTPGREQRGISRKIEDEEERARLKEIVSKLKLEEGLGVIVRTASVGQTKTALERDLSFLKRLWKEVRQKGTVQDSPSLVYQELDLASRAVRDYLTEDVGEVWVDDKETADRVGEMTSLVFPRRRSIVKTADPEPGLWDRFNLRKQIEQLHGRDVTLPSGGRIVIDHTEALTAVDVNSGKIAGESNFREMALRTNMEAAIEVAHQLRLRDIGGQVVIDFIEMKDRKHTAEVEKAMRNALKNDRARTDVGKISHFGLLELVRQRLGSSAISVSTEPCPHCEGSGNRRNMEWRALQVLREIYRQVRKDGSSELITLKAPRDLAFYLLNQKRERLSGWEAEFQKTIRILPEE